MRLKKLLAAVAVASAAVAVAVLPSVAVDGGVTRSQAAESAADGEPSTRWLKETAEEPQAEGPPAVPAFTAGSPALRADAARVARHLPGFTLVRQQVLTFAGDRRHARFEFQDDSGTSAHIFIDTLLHAHGVRLEHSDRIVELAIDSRGRELAVVRSADGFTVELAEHSGRHVRVVVDGSGTLTVDDVKALAVTALGSASA